MISKEARYTRHILGVNTVWWRIMVWNEKGGKRQIFSIEQTSRSMELRAQEGFKRMR